MSEISLKSPHLKQRDLDYVRLVAKVTLGACVTDDIDIPGLTITSVVAEGFSLSGFEAESGVAIDTDRKGGLNILTLGTIVGNADPGDIHVISADGDSCATAGVRTFDVVIGDGTANLLDLTADSFSDALVEFIIPIKAKDF